MKKISVKIIIMACIIWIAPITALYAGADIMVEEPDFSFGSVPDGTQVTHDFVISNPGDEILNIQRVVSSCGCTVADYPKTVAPGSTGIIHVKANTSGYGGRTFNRQLLIRTNITGKESFRLRITGKVE